MVWLFDVVWVCLLCVGLVGWFGTSVGCLLRWVIYICFLFCFHSCLVLLVCFGCVFVFACDYGFVLRLICCVMVVLLLVFDVVDYF